MCVYVCVCVCACVCVYVCMYVYIICCGAMEPQWPGVYLSCMHTIHVCMLHVVGVHTQLAISLHVEAILDQCGIWHSCLYSSILVAEGDKTHVASLASN